MTLETKVRINTRSMQPIVLGMFLFLYGCQERMPLELTSDQPQSDLEVISLQPSTESAQSKSSVDTTGVLNTEESKYYGTMFVSGVTYDVGGARQIIAYSRVTLSDKNEAVEVRGRRIGFRAMDVGKVQIDGMEMVKSQKLIRFQDFLTFGPRDTSIGPQYVLANRNGRDAKDFNFRFNSRFEWKIGGRLPFARPFDVSIQTPDEVTITSPRSNSIILKNEDVRVRWNGKAKAFRLIISGIKGSDLQPYLQINLKEESGAVTIPAKVLRLLPIETTQTYVFSFISSNESRSRVSEFPDDILVVASSVHNIVLTIQ